MSVPRLYTGVSGLWVVTLAFIASATPESATPEDRHPGDAAFRRCVIFHPADGRGIPSAFPPLKGRMARISLSLPS